MHIVVDYRPQKKHKERVHITAGGNLIAYPVITIAEDI